MNQQKDQTKIKQNAAQRENQMEIQKRSGKKRKIE